MTYESSSGVSVPYIAWEIQLTCNMGCPFCYSSSYNRFKRSESRDRMPLHKILAGLETLRDAGLGVEYINWSGGEPLLRHQELPTILRAARRLGFRNIVSTNGMFSAVPDLGDKHNRAVSNARFAAYMREGLEPWLDWLSVSWDSGDRGTNNGMMRKQPDGKAGSTHHYDDIQALLDLQRLHPHRFRLKVNTLITRANLNRGVLEMGDAFRELAVVWKLVQFNPRECPPESRRRYEIGDEAFQGIWEAVNARYSGAEGFEGLILAKRLYDGSDEPYCFLVVNTSGEVLLPKGEDHVKLAHLYDGAGDHVPPKLLRRRIANRLEEEIRRTQVYRNHSQNGRLSPQRVFARLNSKILIHSYPNSRSQMECCVERQGTSTSTRSRASLQDAESFNDSEDSHSHEFGRHPPSKTQLGDTVRDCCLCRRWMTTGSWPAWQPTLATAVR